jgi:hypothetical protein
MVNAASEEYTMTESGETVHGRYVIRTFSSGTKVSARAFTFGKPVAFAEGKSMVAANRVVNGLEDMLRRTLGERVELQTRLTAELWPACADVN